MLVHCKWLIFTKVLLLEGGVGRKMSKISTAWRQLRVYGLFIFGDPDEITRKYKDGFQRPTADSIRRTRFKNVKLRETSKQSV